MGIDYLLSRITCERLTNEQEQAIGKDIRKGDQSAMDRMVMANIPLAVRIANDYRGHGVDLDDLAASAIVGLHEAAKKYDNRRGKFSVLAQFHIKNAIRNELNMHGGGMRKPEGFIDKIRAINATATALEAKLGRAPTDAEIGKELGMKAEAIRWRRNAVTYVNSIDDEVPGTEQKVEDIIADPDARLPWQDLEQDGVREMISEALQCLSVREQKIIVWRFGINGDEEPKTLDEIGKLLKLTRERIRQLEGAAKKKLAAAIRRRNPWECGVKEEKIRMPDPHHQHGCPVCHRVVINGDGCPNCIAAGRTPAPAESLQWFDEPALVWEAEAVA